MVSKISTTWDAATTLAALAANRRTKNLAAARDVVLVTRYCELNGTPDEVEVDGRTVVPGCERMIQPGGVGTPRIREFALADPSARMHRSHDATRLVDAEVVRIVDSIGPRRLERVVEAAVICADPDAAERRSTSVTTVRCRSCRRYGTGARTSSSARTCPT